MGGVRTTITTPRYLTLPTLPACLRLPTCLPGYLHYYLRCKCLRGCFTGCCPRPSPPSSSNAVLRGSPRIVFFVWAPTHRQSSSPASAPHRKTKHSTDCYTVTPGFEPYRLLSPPSTRAYWQINIDQRAEAQHHAGAKQYGKCSHRVDPAGWASLAAQSIDRAILSSSSPPLTLIKSCA